MRLKKTQPGSPVIPFLNQFEIKREAADGAVSRQGEATTYRNDLGVESDAKTFAATAAVTFIRIDELEAFVQTFPDEV